MNVTSIKNILVSNTFKNVKYGKTCYHKFILIVLPSADREKNYIFRNEHFTFRIDKAVLQLFVDIATCIHLQKENENKFSNVFYVIHELIYICKQFII